LSTGEVVTLQIYDFAHDDLLTGDKAGITFGCKNLLNTTRRTEATNTNANGYANSELGQWISNDLFNSLPVDLQQVIKTVVKKTSAGNQSTTIVTNPLKTFLFSGVETGLSNTALAAGEGATYPIFTNDASRIKRIGASANAWWLRSPRINTLGDVWGVAYTGILGAYGASNALGVCFGFCV
jgi:hypothetical protein